MTENFSRRLAHANKHAEQKAENELKYLRDSITALKREMDKLRWGGKDY